MVNVARIDSDAPFRLRAVPGKGRIGAGLERTSAICRRVSCAVAVNGDFWRRGTDEPVGGVVSFRELLRTPSLDHAQVTIHDDGTLRSGPVTLRASLVAEDLQPMRIDGVNRRPAVDELVLMTPAHGRSTRTPKDTIEIRLVAESAGGVLRLSETTVVRIAKYGSDAGDMAIPEDGAVLSGRGKGAVAIRAWLDRIRKRRTSREALLRLESSPDAVESVGGSPILVSGGQVLPREETTSFVRGRHPRTVIGWTKSNDVLLVTIDGRQPGYSNGMTLTEAARFMRNLEAVEAVNLDGGGSSTFVVDGAVVNRPSDRAVRASHGIRIVHAASGRGVIGNVERPVAIAVVAVPSNDRAAEALERNTDALRRLPLLEVIDAEVPHQSDPASDPTGSLPILALSVAEDHDLPLRWTAMVSVAVGFVLAALASAYDRGRRAGR